MFYERLNNLCRKNGTTVAEVAENVLDVSSGTPTGWKRGTSPKASVVYAAAVHFGVSTDYLLGLSDDMGSATNGAHFLLNQDEVTLINSLRKSDEPTRNAIMKMVSAAFALPINKKMAPTIPSAFLSPQDEKISQPKPKRRFDKRVEGKAAAGLPINSIPDTETCISVPAKYLSERYFIVQAQGDSMIDAHINDGDYCVFQKDAYFDEGRIMLVQVDGSADAPDVTIKRVFRHGKSVELHSENAKYSPLLYSADSVQLMGILVDVLAPDA